MGGAKKKTYIAVGGMVSPIEIVKRLCHHRCRGGVLSLLSLSSLGGSSLSLMRVVFVSYDGRRRLDGHQCRCCRCALLHRCCGLGL